MSNTLTKKIRNETNGPQKVFQATSNEISNYSIDYYGNN